MEAIELYGKDTVKFGFLKEFIQEGTIEMLSFLEVDQEEKNFLQVRDPNNQEYRFNNFKVVEQPGDNSISFTPVVVGCKAYLKINSSEKIHVDVIRKDGTWVSGYNLEPGEIRVDFDQKDYKTYTLKVDQVKEAALDPDIMKQKFREKLAFLEAESQKDMTPFEKELADIRKQFEVDEQLLKMYEDKDPIAVEKLISDVRAAMEKAEEHIRIFVKAKADKTIAIEQQLKETR